MSRREENSGLIDLDALLAQMDRGEAGVRHVATAPMSTRTVAAPARAPVPVPLPPAAADDSLEGLAAPASSTRAIPEALAPGSARLAASTRSSRRRLVVAGGVAAAALAAMVVARVAHAPGMQGASTTAQAAAAPPAGLEPSRPIALSAVVPVAQAPSVVPPGVLPDAVEETTTALSPRSPSAPARARSTSVPAVAGAKVAKVTAVDLGAAATANPGDLGGAMRSAVGPRAEEKATTDATTGSGARQLRPSPGAVVGALGAVLPAARACLGPDDAVRSGAIVFRSDGSVARVELRGSKAEDACVRAALSRARVGAFADDTFTSRVTVRP